MANENELSFEEARELAVSDPVAWVATYLELNEMEDGPGEYGANDNTKSLGGLILIEVDSEGGHEGDGEHATVTYAITPENGVVVNGRVKGAVAYVEWCGHYESYNGIEWDEDGCYVVTPVDVVVVQYHAVN